MESEESRKEKYYFESQFCYFCDPMDRKHQVIHEQIY